MSDNTTTGIPLFIFQYRCANFSFANIYSIKLASCKTRNIVSSRRIGETCKGELCRYLRYSRYICEINCVTRILFIKYSLNYIDNRYKLIKIFACSVMPENVCA